MTISIRLNPEVEKRLEFLSASTGRTKSYYLRELIEKGINDLEDYYLASQVLERVKKGQERVFSSEDVRRKIEAMED